MKGKSKIPYRQKTSKYISTQKYDSSEEKQKYLKNVLLSKDRYLRGHCQPRSEAVPASLASTHKHESPNLLQNGDPQEPALLPDSYIAAGGETSGDQHAVEVGKIAPGKVINL